MEARRSRQMVYACHPLTASGLGAGAFVPLIERNRGKQVVIVSGTVLLDSRGRRHQVLRCKIIITRASVTGASVER
jgi:hypothetical protein